MPSLPRKSAIFLFLAAAIHLAAQAPLPEKPDPKDLRVLIEPRFQAPPVWELLPGAKEIGVSVGRLDKKGEPVFLKPDELKLLGKDLEAARKAAMPGIEQRLEGLKPKKVLAPDGKTSTHSIYHSKDPLTASIILTPKLWERHKEEYGESLLAIVPDRYTVVIVRADAEILEARAALLLGIFEKSIYPISLEVLQVREDGIRVIGNLGTP
ncbi:MAG: hypothetical protein ACKO2G_09245 [Verrucomicrobiales bacterium]